MQCKRLRRKKNDRIRRVERSSKRYSSENQAIIEKLEKEVRENIG